MTTGAPASPRVTVLMAAYNEAAYLVEALDSVLAQTFRDFELVVVNDGSTDRTPAILATYQACDRRLRGVHLPTNVGFAAALNIGLSRDGGEYVARADADDVQRPERLQRQVEFLDSHPSVGLVGARCGVIGGGGRRDLPRVERSYRSLPTTDRDIRRYLAADNPFVHSAVMFRRELLTMLAPLYDSRYRPYEDYELWVRLATFTGMANLPDILVYRREHELSMTRRMSRRRAYWERLRMQARAARALGLTPVGAWAMARSALQLLRFGSLETLQAWSTRCE